jgi:CheY-like chemotaxis protein
MAGDGPAALECLARSSFDVVFLDLRMPGMSGMDVYQRLQERDRKQAERVVLMTADSASLEVRVFLNSVERPVLLKPFDLGAIHEAIAKVTPPAP